MKKEDLNRFKTDLWKDDSWASVDYYNNWFISSAPYAFKKARDGVLNKVKSALYTLDYLNKIEAKTLYEHPEIIGILRACTAPPLAIDRLAGLAYTNRGFITRMEKGKIPTNMDEKSIMQQLNTVSSIINKLLDYYLFPWIKQGVTPSAQSLNRSAAIVSDRMTGSLADPIIRNSQEQRQLDAIYKYLKNKGYRYIPSNELGSVMLMPPLSYTFHVNCPVNLGDTTVNMPIDVAIQTMETSQTKGLPLLVECKSAGDFTNTNKRRKEEALKVMQLRQTYQENVTFILFLCGYFDTSYLGYEASEGIDWVWEHRITDFETFGI